MLWIIYWMPQPHTNIKGQEDIVALIIRKEERKNKAFSGKGKRKRSMVFSEECC